VSSSACPLLAKTRETALGSGKAPLLENREKWGTLDLFAS